MKLYGNTYNFPTCKIVEALVFVKNSIFNKSADRRFLFLIEKRKVMRTLRNLFTSVLCLLMFVSLSACAVGGDVEPTTTPTPSTVPNAPVYEVLRVGMEAGYPPYNWQEDTATDTNMPISNVEGAYVDGYDVRIVQTLQEELGIEMEIVKLSWEGLIEALNNGQIDLIIAGMADTEERKESINFSVAYTIPAEYCILVQSGSDYASATTLNDFGGASILGQQNTQYDTVIDQIEGVNHVAAVGDVANMILRLREGTVDGLVFDESIADAYMLAYPGEFEVVLFEEGQGFDKGFSGGCVGLRKEDTALQSSINEVLDNISIDQRYEWNDWAEANMPS